MSWEGRGRGDKNHQKDEGSPKRAGIDFANKGEQKFAEILRKREIQSKEQKGKMKRLEFHSRKYQQ